MIESPSFVLQSFVEKIFGLFSLVIEGVCCVIGHLDRRRCRRHLTIFISEFKDFFAGVVPQIKVFQFVPEPIEIYPRRWRGLSRQQRLHRSSVVSLNRRCRVFDVAVVVVVVVVVHDDAVAFEATSLQLPSMSNGAISSGCVRAAPRNPTTTTTTKASFAGTWMGVWRLEAPLDGRQGAKQGNSGGRTKSEAKRLFSICCWPRRYFVPFLRALFHPPKRASFVRHATWREWVSEWMTRSSIGNNNAESKAKQDGNIMLVCVCVCSNIPFSGVAFFASFALRP